MFFSTALKNHADIHAGQWCRQKNRQMVLRTAPPDFRSMAINRVLMNNAEMHVILYKKYFPDLYYTQNLTITGAQCTDGA